MARARFARAIPTRRLAPHRLSTSRLPLQGYAERVLERGQFPLSRIADDEGHERARRGAVRRDEGLVAGESLRRVVRP
jgi:hypothetical protein